MAGVCRVCGAEMSPYSVAEARMNVDNCICPDPGHFHIKTVPTLPAPLGDIR